MTTTPDVLLDPFADLTDEGPCFFERITETCDVANPKQRMELLDAWHTRLRLVVVTLRVRMKRSGESENSELQKMVRIVNRVEESIHKHYMLEARIRDLSGSGDICP